MPGYGPAAPVPVFQWQAEFEQLLRLYCRRRPKRVLEIGTYHGGTLYHWLQNALPGTRVVSVDSYLTGIDNRALYQDWCPPRVGVIVIEGDSNSDETAAAVERFGPFDWVWIDADHRLGPVTRDWELYSAMCARNATVCFHDILPPSVSFPDYGVNLLWADLKARYRYEEFIQDASALWGGIGVVFP
jgi:predicted O-methyltransferase YrrM